MFVLFIFASRYGPKPPFKRFACAASQISVELCKSTACAARVRLRSFVSIYSIFCPVPFLWPRNWKLEVHFWSSGHLRFALHALFLGRIAASLWWAQSGSLFQCTQCPSLCSQKCKLVVLDWNAGWSYLSFITSHFILATENQRCLLIWALAFSTSKYRLCVVAEFLRNEFHEHSR